MTTPFPLNAGTLQKRSAHIGGQNLAYLTTPGFAFWSSISPAQELLADSLNSFALRRFYVLGCGHGAWLARLLSDSPHAETWFTDPSSAALECALATLQLNGISHAKASTAISVIQQFSESFDQVALLLPKSRPLTRRWLVEAFHCLCPGGELFVAGANDLGIQSIARDAQMLFGNQAILAYKKGNRLLCYQKTTSPPTRPSWANEPGIAPGTFRQLSFPGNEQTLSSLPGVFSWDKIDEATLLLLQHLPPVSGKSVLDFGCGYGILGIHAALSGAARVDLLDVDILAIASTTHNLDKLHLTNAAAILGNGLSPVLPNRYNLILTNPPFHAGKEVDTAITRSFITQSSSLLKPGGALLLVANRFLPYRELLAQQYAAVESIASTPRFTIWRAQV